MAKLYFKVEADYEKVIKLREECKKLEDQLKNMDSGTSPASIRKMEEQLADTRREMTGMVSDAVKAGAQMEHGFKAKIFEASKAVNELSDKIINQRSIVRKASDEAKRLGEAYRDALKNSPSDADGLLERYKAVRATLQGEKTVLFGLTQEQAKARLSVKKLRDEYNLYKEDAAEVKSGNDDISDSLQEMTSLLGKAVGIIGGTAALKELASQIVRVRGEFQEMETSIETMVGKNVAGKIIPQIKELAKISPLTMSDMVGAEKMMLGFNIQAEDTIKYLKALSDLSMGSSSKFNSLTLAFSQMSAAGKLMGQDLNQMINAGFNPLQEISKQTGKSIAQLKEEMSKGAVSAEMVQKAFISATSAGGKFFNMSENASKTINGQISMMEDAMDAAFNEIGEASEGFIIKAISTTTSLIENYEKVGKVLIGLVATYGTYKAAVLAVMAVEEARVQFALASMEGMTKMKAITTILTEKTKSLFKVLSLNPYAMIAAAVVGLVATMWALADSTSAAERAQKRYNKELEDFTKKEEDRKARIEELVKIIQDKNETEYAQVKAYEELKRLSPGLTSAYTREELAVASLTEAQKELNKERDKREHQNIVDNINKYKSLIKKINDELSVLFKMGGGNNQKIQSLRKELGDAKADLKQWENELKKYDTLKKQAEEEAKPIDVKIFEAEADLKQIESECDKAKKKLEEEQKKAAENPLYTIPVWVEIQYKNKEKAKEAQRKKVDELHAQQSVEKESYGKSYKAAKEAWLTAKKNFEEIERDKEKFTVEQFNKSKKALDEAEANFKALGGDVSNKMHQNVSDLVKKRKEILEEQKRISELEERSSRELEDMSAKTERQAAQASIDAMKDGAEKIRRQREQDNRNELEDIERQKNDYVAKYIQAQKEIFEAKERLKAKQDAKYKMKNFDSSGVHVDTSAFDKMKSDVRKRQFMEDLKAQEDAWNEYLRRYGNYQQQKQAINDYYDKKAKEAKTAGEAAIIEKERLNALDELDERMKGSTTLMGQLFADASEMSVSEIQKIIDKAELLMAYLAATKDEQGNATIGGKKVSEKDILNLGISKNSLENLAVAPEKVKAISDAIKGLKGELRGKSPWAAFVEDVKKGIDTIKNAKGDTAEIGKGIESLGNSFSGIAPSINEMGNSLGTIFGDDDLGVKISHITEAVSGLGEAAKGVGQIVVGSMTGDAASILNGTMSATKGISSVVSAVKSLSRADYSGYEKMKDRYKNLVSLWDDLISRKTEYINIDYGIEAQKAAEEAERLVEMNIKRQRDLMEKLAKSGASAGSHSLGYRINERLDSGDWERLSNLLGKTITDQSELWKLSSDEIEKILSDERLISVLDRVNSDFVEYLQNIVKYGDQLDDIAEKQKSAIAGLSFDEFRDGYIDMLADLESTNEDFAESFEKQMQNAIFRALIADQFSDRIKKLYDLWVNMGEDGISKNESIVLNYLQQNLTDDILDKRKELMELFGWQTEEEKNKIRGMEELQKAYEKLSESVSKVYSSERVSALQEQNNILEKQKRLVEERIAIEKNADTLKDYQNQLEDINAQIAENKEAMKDAIFGNDVQSAINDFVSAYTNALGGGDTSDVAADFVENMIKSMVVEAMKADASPVVGAVRDKLIESWKDGVISPEEQKAVQDLIEQLNNQFGEKYEWADNLFGQSSEIKGLKELKQAYSDLSREMDEVYSSEKAKLIGEQISLLEKQKELLEASIAKGGDKNALEGWKDELHGIEQELEDAKETQIDAIFGSDIKNAISNFVNAYTDALSKGSMKNVSKNVIDDMMRGMVVEAMKSDASPVIKAVRDKMSEAMSDGTMSEEERSEIQNMIDHFNDALQGKYGWADELLKEQSSEINGLEELQKAYSDLGDKIEKAYSSDKVKLIEERIRLLEQQKSLIEGSIAKGGDEDVLKAWKEQLEDINRELENTKGNAVDAIFGSDIQSAISSFVDAYTQAMAGGDYTNVSKDVVENLIKGMIVEAMKADASPVLDAVRQQLSEAWKDGTISPDEQKNIQGLIDKLNSDFGDKYKWAENLFREQTSEIKGLKELQKAYDKLSYEMDKAYSEERVRVIDGQIALLEKQKDLIEDNISKGGSKEILEEWKEQLESVDREISNAKESKIDAIFGNDVQSAIDGFANSLIDAWSRGEDKAKSAEQVVKDIIRGMVAESMKMDMAPQVEELRKKLAEMYKDGVISSDESSIISELVKNMTEAIEKQYKWADEFLKEEEEKMEKTFSGMTFESMRDDFVSQLSDMETSYENMCDSFEDKLKQSIIKGFLESKYKNQIQKIINAWDAYGDSNNINPDELDSLREQYKEIVGSMIKDRDELAKEMGWDKFQQGATSKSAMSMTEETGESLIGRATAMYESDLRREKIQSEQLAVMRAMTLGKGVQTPITELTGPVDRLIESGTKMYSIADDTRNILANSYVELQQIRDNTGAIVKPIKQMQKDIEQVKRNTERL